MAIAMEVAYVRDLPAVANDSEILTCEFAAAVRIPKRSTSPLALRQRMSAWPSPLKSPVPAICQLLPTIPRS